MAGYNKLNKRPDLRDAILRNQVTSLLWNGKLETTFARAKAVQRIAEKIIALAVMNSDNPEKLKELRARSQKLCDKYPFHRLLSFQPLFPFSTLHSIP